MLGALLVSTSAAAHAADNVCRSKRLSEASVSASVELDDRRRTQTKVLSRLTVHVPQEWPYATGLLLGKDSEEYRRAMRCLLRGDASQAQWWGEWRSGIPQVSSEKGGVRIQVDSYGWAQNQGMLYVGPWDIDIGKDRWTVALNPPALAQAHWITITVKPGTSSILSATPAPSAKDDDNGLVWRQKAGQAMPQVSVRLDPPWQRSWAAQQERLRFQLGNDTSGLPWQLSTAALLLLAVRRTRRSGPLSPDESLAVRTATSWAGLCVLLSLLYSGDNLFYDVMQRQGDKAAWAAQQAHHGLLINLALGWILFLFGRPRRLTIWLAAAVLTLPGLVVALIPRSFGLTANALLLDSSSDGAVLALFIASGCVFAFLLLGSTAAAWRLASAVGLVSRAPVVVPTGPNAARALTLRWTAPLIALAVAIISLCAAGTSEWGWQRASWLSAHADAQYGIDHLQALRQDLAWFAVNSQDWWISSIWWALSGLVALAVLRARAHRTTPALQDPGRVDEFWMLLLFPLLAGLGLGAFVGNYTMAGLWFFLNLGALALAITTCRGKGVLDQPLQHSGVNLRTAIAPSRRRDLLDRARRFRETHAKLRRLDQGQSDDAAHDRRSLERELRGLHRWRTSAGTVDRLPADVSVVDAALALGPEDSWWANGRRAARIAALVGLPASALLVWAEGINGEFLTSTLNWQFGLPNIVMGAVYWEITWAAAGFLLGSLWRQLPGRRGPVRILPLVGAYALPIGIDALGKLVTREEQTNLALYALSMLLVLTITSIVFDLHVFRGERRYWQSRLGLLLSVYQMRYFSLQAAYLLAQLVALFTLWQFFTEGGGPPERSAGNSGGGAGP
ncbi:DUF6185 family protein [Streptomyces sp. NPDC050256]|uniref:DUF6185 family protein n=1 Tax=Streptomyces sp. NPDC050256 TaxID=3365607 RepID=UPI00379422BC